MYEIYEKLRDGKGWKNTDVSEMTGVSNMTLSDWKNGKSIPKLDKYILLADLFGVSLDYIVRGRSQGNCNEEDLMFINKIKGENGLSDSIGKFLSLSNTKKKHVLELIDLLCE